MIKENPAPSIGSRNSLITAQRPKAKKPPIVQIIKSKIPIIFIYKFNVKLTSESTIMKVALRCWRNADYPLFNFSATCSIRKLL